MQLIILLSPLDRQQCDAFVRLFYIVCYFIIHMLIFGTVKIYMLAICNDSVKNIESNILYQRIIL